MAAVTERRATTILNKAQGVYKWGERDCLTTACAMLSIPLETYKSAHDLTEAAAMATAIEKYGSIPNAHQSIMSKVSGIAECDPPAEPGDVVILSGDINLGHGSWKTSERGELMAFVADNCEIYQWQPSGLLPVRDDYKIKMIFRCHRL